MKYKNMGFGTAMAYLKQRRPRVNPNVGFIEQLKLYQEKCRESKGEIKRVVRVKTEENEVKENEDNSTTNGNQMSMVVIKNNKQSIQDKRTRLIF